MATKRKPHNPKLVKQGEALREVWMILDFAQFLCKTYAVKPNREKLEELKKCAVKLNEKLKEVKP